MSELLGQYWWLILVALLVGIIVAWWVFAVAGRKTRVETARKPDVLDEGAAPAQRNQALIDAPSAAAGISPTTPQPPPAPPAPEAAHPAAPIPVAPGTDGAEADDLSRIKGVGPKLKAMLHALGITRFEQIAGWTDADIDRIDPQLGAFQGRIRRDNWVEQARLLAAGDTEGFASKFGNV